MISRTTNEDRMPQVAVVVLVAICAGLLSFFIMQSQQPGDPSGRAATDAELECILDDQRSNDECIEQAPTWAKHPVWYSLGVGLVVLVVGRGYIFMRRLEGSR